MSESLIAVAGGGRVGQALGRLLHVQGEPVVAVACRDAERARSAARFIGAGVRALSFEELADVATRVLITVPDDAIRQVASTLAEAGMRGIALHTCGAFGTEVLEPLSTSGVACGVLHPLQTVPTPESDLHGISFAIEGAPEAKCWASEIAESSGGFVLEIPAERKPLYHAAAVMASNYLVTLLDAAIELMCRAGAGEEESRRALLPLVEAAVANALNNGPAAALTGPIRRGDAGTVAAHLEALPSGRERELYRVLGLETVDLAQRAGLDKEVAGQLRRLLRDNEENDA